MSSDAEVASSLRKTISDLVRSGAKTVLATLCAFECSAMALYQADLFRRLYLYAAPFLRSELQWTLGASLGISDALRKAWVLRNVVCIFFGFARSFKDTLLLPPTASRTLGCPSTAFRSPFRYGSASYPFRSFRVHRKINDLKKGARFCNRFTTLSSQSSQFLPGVTATFCTV